MWKTKPLHYLFCLIQTICKKGQTLAISTNNISNITKLSVSFVSIIGIRSTVKSVINVQ